MTGKKAPISYTVILGSLGEIKRSQRFWCPVSTHRRKFKRHRLYQPIICFEFQLWGFCWDFLKVTAKSNLNSGLFISSATRAPNIFKAMMSMAVLSSGGTVLNGPTRSQEVLEGYSTKQQRSRTERIQEGAVGLDLGAQSIFKGREKKKPKADKWKVQCDQMQSITGRI